jgi:hypothetical protein
MATLLITFEAKSLWVDYSMIARAIKKYQSIRLTEHTYAIETNEDPGAVLQKLQPLVESSNLYIFTCKSPFSGFGPESSNKWLVQRLRPETKLHISKD